MIPGCAARGIVLEAALLLPSLTVRITRRFWASHACLPEREGTTRGAQALGGDAPHALRPPRLRRRASVSVVFCRPRSAFSSLAQTGTENRTGVTRDTLFILRQSSGAYPSYRFLCSAPMTVSSSSLASSNVECTPLFLDVDH